MPAPTKRLAAAYAALHSAERTTDAHRQVSVNHAELRLVLDAARDTMANERRLRIRAGIAAMQALIADGDYADHVQPDELARRALSYADALLDAVEASEARRAA